MFKHRKPTAQRAPRILPAWLQQLLEHVATILVGPPEEAKPIMTYEEAMGFFVTRRPQGIPVQQGVILRERRPEGFLVIQGFMDSNNSFIKDQKGNECVRQLLVQKLDNELLQAFGDEDIIIVR